MRFKLFLLAAVAALATAMPARATLVLEWHLNSVASTAYQQQANTDPVSGPAGNGDYATMAITGPAIAGNSLSLPAGSSAFIQVVLHQINNTGPNTITYDSVNGGTGIGLNGYGVQVNNSAPAIATHFQPSNNNANTRGTNLYGFAGNGTPNASNYSVVQGGIQGAGQPTSFTIVRDITTSDWYQADGFYPLFNFKFTAGSTAGSGQLTFSDPSAGADTGTPSNPNMDAGIYSNTPVLNFTVTAVPEPSSMVLAGLGLAGLGFRLRRKKVVTEVAA